MNDDRRAGSRALTIVIHGATVSWDSVSSGVSSRPQISGDGTESGVSSVKSLSKSRARTDGRELL